nr:conserved hypothetical protein [uncultured archaeon GZfos3D4]
MKSKKIRLVVLTAILTISAFSVISTPVSAQPVEVWNVTWPGLGTAVATTEDSVYLAGVNTNGTDAFLNKYDKDGNLIWNSTWEMFAPEVGFSNDVATAAARDSVYLAGTCGFSNVTGGAFLNKYDSDGNLLWNITWGTVFTAGYATAAAEDCVFLAGETAPSNVSDFDAFLNKYDKDGNLLWNITWGGPAGTYSAFATATSGDGVYVAGRAPGGKTFLNKYNSTDGSLMWNLTWKGDGMGVATATGDNAVYMAGNTLPATFLNKYNSTDGSLIWNITWGKTGGDHGRAIATAEDGVVYLAGSKSVFDSESDSFLVKFSEPTPIPKPTPVPATGSISVSSSPSGARATIDGLNWIGSTPCKTSSDLPSGSYTLRLSIEGYHDWSQTVEVKANETSEVHATLTPVPTPPGFEAGFTIAGLLAVAYLVLRRR